MPGHAKTRVAVAVVAAVLGVSACADNIDSSAGCPLTCSDPSNKVQTVTLDAVVIDTTVPAGLGMGTEQVMLLASRGDTVDTRLIYRFDSLPATALATKTATTPTAITSVDSVFLRLHFDSLAANVNVPVTLSLYDVDSVGVNDTSPAALAALFTPARLIGTRTLAAGKAVDTVSVQLSNAAVLAKIQNHLPLRIGVQVTASASVSLRQPASETAFGASLYMRVSSDFGVPAVTLAPNSRIEGNNYAESAALRDFMIVVIGTPPPPAGMLAVGGVPASRTYFRFSVPPILVDSSIVVRATLLMTQVPSGSPDPTDTMSVQPDVVVAGTAVNDIGRAAQITSSTLIPFETFKTFPTTSGAQEIEVAPAFSVWAAQTEATLPRALILMSGREDGSAQQVLFYSTEATDPTVRPKLRISYTPRTRIGTP